LRIVFDATSGSSAGLSSNDVGPKASMLADLDAGTAPLLELRDVAGHAYIRLHLDDLAMLGLPIPADLGGELATIGKILGGRWFVVPGSGAARSSHDSASASSAISGLTFPRGTQVTAGTSAAGTTIVIRGGLGNELRDLFVEINLLDPSAASKLPPAAGASRYVATLHTGPNGVLRTVAVQLSAGTESVVVDATASHSPVSIGVPAGALPFPTKALGALIAGLVGGSGASSS
jgi:hypothetical protein